MKTRATPHFLEYAGAAVLLLAAFFPLVDITHPPGSEPIGGITRQAMALVPLALLAFVAARRGRVGLLVWLGILPLLLLGLYAGYRYSQQPYMAQVPLWGLSLCGLAFLLFIGALIEKKALEPGDHGKPSVVARRLRPLAWGAIVLAALATLSLGGQRLLERQKRLQRLQEMASYHNQTLPNLIKSLPGQLGAPSVLHQLDAVISANRDLDSAINEARRRGVLTDLAPWQTLLETECMFLEAHRDLWRSRATLKESLMRLADKN